MPARRLSMRKIKRSPAPDVGVSSKPATSRPAVQFIPALRPQLSARAPMRPDYPGRCPADLDDGQLERLLFPAVPKASSGRACRAGLAHRLYRHEAEERHQVPALAGIPGPAPQWLQLQLVLRSLPALAGKTGSVHAAESPCRREAVYRLYRAHHCCHQPPHR